MASIYDNGRCKRCFRRLPIKYMKGGLCNRCREEVGLPVQKIIIPPFLLLFGGKHRLKMFIFNDSDDEYTVFANNYGDAVKNLIEDLDDVDASNSLEDLGIYYSTEYDVIEGDVLRRSLR